MREGLPPTESSKLKPETASTRHPSFREAFRFWLKLGFISFGGPTGQIAIMQAELVEKKKWISQSRFLHALNFCMLLPGPEAQQLAIYVGWLLHKTWGGIVAGALFVIPSMFVLWALSYVYVAYGNLPWLAAIFYGLKPAVMAIVAFAVVRIGSKALKNSVMWSIAIVAFVAIFFLKVPFPIIVMGAAAVGFLGGKYWKEKFFLTSGQGSSKETHRAALDDDNEMSKQAKPSIAWSLQVGSVCLLLWWFPVFLCGLWQGWDGILFREGLFFSKAAVVTFGGAYAVLPYVAQQAVDHHGWLTTSQMMDGLGMAETTPGPLIMVTQFVGFLGGWNNPGTLSPLTAATLGALITTWTTFLPSFLFTLLGAPHIEQMRGHVKITSALSAVTAAVVGVVLNLAVWFGIHVLLPDGNMLDWFALALSAVAFIGMLKWKWDVIWVIVASGLLGLVYKFGLQL